MKQWKEIFFYNKKDRVASLILLFLGLLLGGSYLAYPHLMNKRTKDKNLTEFAKFQQELIPIYSSNTTKEERNIAPTSSLNKNNKLAEGQKIDLNSANSKALKKVPGIGDTFAKRIIEYRLALGGFININQLKEVKGISEKKLEKIEPYFTIDSPHKKQNLLTLIKSNHPYLDEKQIASISSYINESKKITSVESLASLDNFTPRDIDRIKDYIHFK